MEAICRCPEGRHQRWKPTVPGPPSHTVDRLEAVCGCQRRQEGQEGALRQGGVGPAAPGPGARGKAGGAGEARRGGLWN